MDASHNLVCIFFWVGWNNETAFIFLQQHVLLCFKHSISLPVIVYYSCEVGLISVHGLEVNLFFRSHLDD